MLMVTHEMDLSCTVPNKVMFMENGPIAEFVLSQAFSENPKEVGSKKFILSIRASRLTPPKFPLNEEFLWSVSRHWRKTGSK